MTGSGGAGSWRITAGPYEIVCDDDADRVDWVWVVARGPAVRSVRVTVAPEAWRAGPGEAPKQVRDAIASRGATAVIEEVRRRDEPPEVVEVGGDGVRSGGRSA